MGMPLKLAQRIRVGSPIAIFGCARLAASFPCDERVPHSKILRELVGHARQSRCRL